MEKSSVPASVDAYIAGFPPAIQVLLDQMRTTIRAAAPEAEEKISYQMPAYFLNGPLVYFGGFKHHIGFYPTPNGTEEFAEELSHYKGAKGSVQFPIDQPLPLDLVKRIVQYRLAVNQKKSPRPR